MMAFMVHTLNPIIFSIYGNIAVRWYGLAYLIGFIVAFFLINWLGKRQGQDFKTEMVSDLVTYGAFGILLGGRLGYALFYSQDLFIKFKSDFPFWGLLAVNEGGMASHGGMIGLVVACLLFAKKYQVSSLYTFDLVALCGPIGIFFGRIANFINGELVGREAPQGTPWTVKFPSDIEFWPSQFPEKLRHLAEVVVHIPGYSREKWLEWVDTYKTTSEARAQIFHGLQDIVEATQTGNTQVVEALAPYLVSRYPSQLYQALLEGLLLFLVLFFLWARDKKPGLIGASFVVFYALARILGEQFRMPDAHIGYQWLNLTRGQWLSVIMLLIGFVLIFVWSKQGAQKIPGWWRRPSIRLHRRHRG
jgi:phosphatidylglycerol---prolipoprotein diacylglyceryl transferase